MKIIKYNKSKSAKGSTRTQGGNGGGIYTNTTPAPSVNLEPYALKTQILWEKGEGNNSVIEKNHNLQAVNDNETAVGKYNQSVSGETIFTVGIGDGEDSRKNGLAVTSSGLSAETASIDNLTSITANMGDVTAKTENVGTLTSQTITNNGLIKTNQFETQTLKAVSGYIQTLMSEEITTEYLEVTKAAHFFKLVIDEIKAVGGRLIITPASAEIHHVDELSDRFRCYFKASDGKKQIYQEFEKDDQIICQTFNASVGTSYDVSNTYYWRLCVGASNSTVTVDGEDFFYVDLSKTDKDKYSVSTPKKGDNIVQLGNRTKEDRQAAIVISAYNDGYLDPEIKAPSLAQYQGINDYSLKTHRLNVISKGLNQFKGAYLNNAGKNLDTKIDDLSTTVTDKTSDITQTIDGIKTRVSNTETSISNVTKTVSDNKAATDKAIANTNSTVTTLTQTVKNNYSTLDQKADSISSRVSANTKSITTVSKKVDDNKAATDKAIANTNSTVTTLTQTVKNNYSTLDQKADGISTKVASNTETITAQGTSISNLKNGLTSTNNTITALTKTVKDNYSTLDQKADSISSTVNSHTKTIEGLDGRVTTNTENISKVKQTADGLTSTVSSIDKKADANSGEITTLKKSVSEIGQSADNIYMKIVNDLQETGIDITSGQINLQATNTNIIGNLNVYKSDTGLIIYDNTNQERVNISNHKVGSFKDANGSANSLRTASGNNAFTNTDVCNNQFTPNWHCTKKSVQSNIIDLGDFTKGDTIKPKYNAVSTSAEEIACNTSFIGTTDDIEDANKNMPKCVAIDNVRVSVMKNGTEIKTYPIGTETGQYKYFVDKVAIDYTLTNGIRSQQKDHNLRWALSKVDGNGKDITEKGLYHVKLYWKFITNVDWTHTVTEDGKYSICIKGDLVFGPVEYLRDDPTHGWGKKGIYSIGDKWYFKNEQTYQLNKKNPQRTTIGTDGIASVIGADKLFYIGQDGIVAKWGNEVLKVGDDGISHTTYHTNDHGTVTMSKTLGGGFTVEASGYNATESNPNVFDVLDGMDVIVSTGNNVYLNFPAKPKPGRIITVIATAGRTWVNFNGVTYMRYNSTDRNYNGPTIQLSRNEVRKYVYEDTSRIWFEI
nr:MAG: hypothetical protein [Bacteriophage sp.]